jgi:hypothetical protein
MASRTRSWPGILSPSKAWGLFKEAVGEVLMVANSNDREIMVHRLAEVFIVALFCQFRVCQRLNSMQSIIIKIRSSCFPLSLTTFVGCGM